MTKFHREDCPTCAGDGAIVKVNPEWLRAKRIAAGLSLRHMAARIGFSPPYISDVEHGRRACTIRIQSAYETLKERAK